jgi:hypothetical protein
LVAEDTVPRYETCPLIISEYWRWPFHDGGLGRWPENGDLCFHAEWPHDLPQGWNEWTIIAADYDSCRAVFALSPTASGHIKADPVPLEPGTGPSFAYGYDGGSPYALYQALIRCVFGTTDAPFTLMQVQGTAKPDQGSSTLWHAIATAEGPLRLPWPTVQHWARPTPPKSATRATPDPVILLPAAWSESDQTAGTTT